MAHVLNIVDGSGTITLNSSNKRVRSYVPESPSVSTEQLRQILAGEFLDNTLTVTESAVVELSGTAVSDIKTAWNALENSLGVSPYAREYTGGGDRVFVTYLPDGLTTTLRSEIVSGAVDPLPDAQDYGRWFTNYKVDVTVVWTRRFYWETAAEVAVPATNSNGTADTTGLAVMNANDGLGTPVRNDYLEVAAADVIGAIPSPIRIEYVVSAGTALRRLHIAHKVQETGGSVAAWQHDIEAESMTLGALATAGAVAGASGGTAVTVTNVPSGGTAAFTATLSATQVGYAVNSWVRIVARFSTPPNNSTTRSRVILKDSLTGTTVAQSDWLTLSSSDHLQVVAAFLFSPTNQGITTYGAVKLVLEFKDSAGTSDFVLDFIQILTAQHGSSYRRLNPVDETYGSVNAGGTITDNMIDGGLYVEGYQRIYAGYGGPVSLRPGRIQRLYFAADAPGGTAPIAKGGTVRVFYRPRYLTL